MTPLAICILRFYLDKVYTTHLPEGSGSSSLLIIKERYFSVSFDGEYLVHECLAVWPTPPSIAGAISDDRVDSYHWLILGHSCVFPVLKECEYCESIVLIVRNSVSPKRKTVLGSQATVVHCNKLFLEHACRPIHR